MIQAKRNEVMKKMVREGRGKLTRIVKAVSQASRLLRIYMGFRLAALLSILGLTVFLLLRERFESVYHICHLFHARHPLIYMTTLPVSKLLPKKSRQKELRKKLQGKLQTR